MLGRGLAGRGVLVSAVVAVSLVLGGVFGGVSVAVAQEGSLASGLLSGGLVVEGSPTATEQRQATEEARLAGPEAVADREASATAYEGLTRPKRRHSQNG